MASSASTPGIGDGARTRTPGGRGLVSLWLFAALVVIDAPALAQNGSGAPGRPLVAVIESPSPRIDPDMVRAHLAVALGRPVVSAADPRAMGLDEVLVLTIGADGSWAVVTHLVSGAALATSLVEGPASSRAVPAWLAVRVRTLLGRGERSPGSTPPAGEPLGEELAAWRIPDEVIDPFPVIPGAGDRTSALSYELLDPWDRNRLRDPWSRRPRSGRPSELTPPPRPRD